MSQRIVVECPDVGEYVCVYFKHGWFQLKKENEGVVFDFFDSDDQSVHTGYMLDSDLDAGVPE